MTNLDIFMNRIELEAVVSEARPFLEKRRIIEFRDANPESFLLILEGDEQDLPRIIRLKIYLSRGLTAIYVTQAPHPRLRRGDETGFSRRVNRALAAMRLAEILLPEGERIVTLCFDEGAEGRRKLRIELFGSRSNLYLLDQNETVIDAFRPARSMSGTREEPVPGSRPSGARRKPPLTVRFPPLQEESLRAARPYLPMNEAAGRFFEELARQRTVARLRGALEKRIAAKLRRTVKKIRNIEEQIETGKEAEEIRRRGDLLKANYHLIRRGMNSVAVDDYSVDPPASVEISLDPKLTPAENIAAFFRRYKKAKGSVAPLRALLDTTRRARDELEAGLEAVATASSIKELEKLEKSAGPARGGRGTAPSKQKQPRGAAHEIRRFRSEQGYDILVGRSGETNHRLTFQTSRGNDIWMHCHNTAGSHVIISLKRGQTAPLETLLAAGLLAVHFSKRRGAGHADVIYTRRKYVRPVKGGGKGQVFAERFKTLHIKHSPESLQKILDSAVAP